jgi:predicted RNA binding protein YcfA (HicA-like mRNA interferase family)
VKEYGKTLRDVLDTNGCYFVRHGKGSHDIWYSPITNKNFSIPRKIPSRHTANDILNQAGIEYKFH